MTATLLRSVPELDSDLATAWRQLAELRENPFLTPEWYSSWLATHPDEQPFAIVWRDGDAVRGVLPLVREGKRLRFAGARRGDWFTPACEPTDEGAMAAACAELLERERGEWQLIQLDRIDCASTWPRALTTAGGALRVRRQRSDVLPYVGFGEDGYEGYWAGRSRNFRSQVGRRRRKLEREHGLVFRMTADATELDKDLETFFVLHEERWEERGGTSALSEDAKAMHRRFAGHALQRGWLRLWVAEADGAPAAAWYGWRIAGRYCYSLSGLSSRYEDLALGNVLLAHTIEQAAAEGSRVYDLMWGDEGYKKRFETDRREAESWIVGRRGTPAWSAAVALDGLTAGARRLPPGLREPAKRLYRAASRS